MIRIDNKIWNSLERAVAWKKVFHDFDSISKKKARAWKGVGCGSLLEYWKVGDWKGDLGVEWFWKCRDIKNIDFLEQSGSF